MQSRHVVPLSILGGSCLLAAAIYLTSDREREGTYPPEPLASSPTSPAPADSRPEVAPWRREPIEPGAKSSAEAGEGAPSAPIDPPNPDPDEPPVAPPPRTSLQAAAVEAFDSKRDEIVRDCWDGSASGPPAVKLRLSLAFDPQGEVIGSGLHEIGPKKEGVAACVGRHLPSLTIDPPQKHRSLQVEVVVP